MNLFSIFQFRWSATLTMLKGIWDARGVGWRGLVKQRKGWMGALRWCRQASGQTEALLFHNNKDPHWSTLRPCNLRGRRGPPACLSWDKWTQMLPTNAERPGWGNERRGRTLKRRLTSFFYPWLRQLSVRLLCFLITTDHRGLRARSIVGNDQRGISLWWRIRTAANL